MNDEQFQDLKQFIEATVSQSEGRTDREIKNLKQELGEHIRQINSRLDDTDEKLNEIQNAVGESLHHVEEASHKQKEVARDHARRITRLEH